MPTSPTSKSAATSGAAKDDKIGLDGNLTFTLQDLIHDLLANDPGGAAKVDISNQFFFGTTDWDRKHQAEYMEANGIVDNGDGTFTITGDFDYSVQIGNKGTWSQAHVDVAHDGDLLFHENFDGYVNLANAPQFGVVDMGPVTGN